MRAVPRFWELYPGICLTNEEKAQKNFSQGNSSVMVGEILSQGSKTSVRDTDIHGWEYKEVDNEGLRSIQV